MGTVQCVTLFLSCCVTLTGMSWSDTLIKHFAVPHFFATLQLDF